MLRNAVAVEALEGRRLLSATPDWALAIGGSGEDSVTDMVTDRSGNVYVAGRFAGAVDFDPSAGVTTLKSGSATLPSGFVAKYSAAGDLIWARPLQTRGVGGFELGLIQALAVDRAGGVYFSGFFSGTVDFNPAKARTFNLATTAADGFVAKWDANGNFVWASKLPSTRLIPAGTDAWALSFGAGDDLFVTGEMRSQGDELNGSAFLGRIDRSNGTVGFTKDIGLEIGTGPSRGRGLATDRAGNVVVVGANEDSPRSFAARYDRTGAQVWGLEFGGNRQGASGVAVDNKGSVFITGEFGGGSSFDNDFDPGAGKAELQTAGGADVYLIRLTADGEFVWARRFGNEHTDAAGDIQRDPAGNLVITGSFQGAVDFDPRRGSFVLDAGTKDDLFVTTLTPTGNFVSAFAVGGKRSQVLTPAPLWIDRTGAILLAGNFRSGQVEMDPGAGTLILSASSDQFDVLLGRYTV